MENLKSSIKTLNIEEQNNITEETTPTIPNNTNEASKYMLKDAEPLAGNMIIKVTSFDQPSTRYYYTPYPLDTNVSIYGEVIAIDPKNDFRIKPGDRVLYNGPVTYQSIEDGAKYVVGSVSNVLLVWRSKKN